MKIIKRILIILIVIIVLLGAGVAILLNLTPNQIGLGNKVLYDNMSLNDMGLGDTKILKIAKSIRNMLNPDEDDIVAVKVDSTIETPKAEAAFGDSNLPKDSDGSYNYLDLITNSVIYDAEYLVSYQDSTLAFIFNQMVVEASESANESFKFLADMEASVEEIGITVVDAEKKLRIVLGVSTESFKSDIENNLGPLKSFVSISDKIFVVCYLGVSANSAGAIITSSENVLVNDSDDKVSKAIFDALVTSLGDFADDDDPKSEINRNVGNAFTTIVGNLGIVGSATVDNNNVVITKTIGDTGITEHQIQIITKIA